MHGMLLDQAHPNVMQVLTPTTCSIADTVSELSCQGQLQQRHSDEEPISGLSEVGSSWVCIHFHIDLQRIK